MGFLNPQGDDLARIDAMPSATDVPLAGATEGLATAAPKGVAGAFAKLADLSNDFLDTDVGQAVSLALPFARAAHNVMTPQMRENANAATKAAAEWAATGSDPRKTGVAGRILTGTTEGLTIGLAGGAVAGPWGAAGLLGATEGYASYKEATAQGVDETTAREQGGLTGLFAAGSALLPMKFGKTLAQNVLGGAAANVTLGAAQRGLTSEVLAANGYQDMAAQYRIFDGEAAAADLILGGGFGAFGHVTARRVNPADMDAAAAVATEEHFNRSAPGVPTDPGVATLHADTMAASLRALHDGEMPSIPADTAQQIVDNVAPGPMHDVAHALHEAAQLELPGFESAAADIKPVEMLAGDMALPWSQQSATKGVPLDDFHDALLGDLVHKFGDEVYEYRTVYDVDGMHVEPITYRQLAEQMQQQRDEIELFGKLHEVAAACFIRNGMGTNLLPTIRMEGPFRHWND